jgi:serine O-acetyltransferase
VTAGGDVTSEDDVDAAARTSVGMLIRADLGRMVVPRGASAWRWRLEAGTKVLLLPRCRAVLLYRLSQPLARRGLHALAYALQSRAIRASGTEISPLADVGPGLLIMHSVGIVVGPQVRIGTDVTLYHNVTLGDGSRPGQPTLGNRVVVGAGAAVLGPVRVGNDVTIGANAVVTVDLPDGVVAAGVPARYRQR